MQFEDGLSSPEKGSSYAKKRASKEAVLPILCNICWQPSAIIRKNMLKQKIVGYTTALLDNIFTELSSNFCIGERELNIFIDIQNMLPFLPATTYSYPSYLSSIRSSLQHVLMLAFAHCGSREDPSLY
jgi:hypothetical protein